jgi:hypothetical protein
MREEIVDINQIGGAEWDMAKGPEYDRKEMQIFYAAIWLSLIPPIASWWISR